MCSEACPFCDIVKGNIKCNIVFEDDYIIAFLDLNPISEGHTLIIPKKNIKDIYAIDEQTAGKIITKAASIGLALKKAFGFDGISIMENNDVFQDVPHFHLHVYGRNKANDIKVKYPKIPKLIPEKIVDQIKKNLSEEVI